MPQAKLARGGMPELSGNMLKIIAAVAMTADHIGYILFPQLPFLRQIGRLAFPIFAFMIAEGCQHTRNPLRYFLSVLVLGVVCQTAYTLAMGQWFLCVPVSFAVAIPLVFALQKWKSALWGGSLGETLLWGGLLLGGVAAVWGVTRYVTVDYGFWGCMMPVGASLFRQTGDMPRRLRGLDRNIVHVLTMAVFMVPLALQLGAWQWWSMLALPFLKLYSGKRGRYRMKYFFYIFYPTHLVLLQGLYMLLKQ